MPFEKDVLKEGGLLRKVQGSLVAEHFMHKQEAFQKEAELLFTRRGKGTKLERRKGTSSAPETMQSRHSRPFRSTDALFDIRNSRLLTV
jgi:hypothetical protein